MSQRNDPALNGATVQLGGEQRDPIKTAIATQPAPADPITLFAPWCDEGERSLRLRIHRARDVATARAARSTHGGARSLFWQAAQIASDRVFARISEPDLRETIDNLARLFVVAGWIERTEAPDAG